MSHFTNMKTSFQNLAYLEKALNKLEISHQKQENKAELKKIEIVIRQ